MCNLTSKYKAMNLSRFTSIENYISLREEQKKTHRVDRLESREKNPLTEGYVTGD